MTVRSRPRAAGRRSLPMPYLDASPLVAGDARSEYNGWMWEILSVREALFS